MVRTGEKGNVGRNETKKVEEIRIVLQPGAKVERQDSSEGLTSSTTSTEQLLVQTDKKDSELPSPSTPTVSPVPPDITLKPAAVMEGAEESSGSDQNELKKIRIVLDVKAGGNLTDGSNIVNTPEDKIKLEQ